MESSGEANGKIIDPTVGGLVWVRRRNGSWWPGRILGPDELPESCLVSPRSGTPVKLLGREDASVDWYNLEKSKRVKAFRCGEYDECIEKAKASLANPCKKAVKYARREDAILHALELESARISKDCLETCSGMDKPGGKLDDAEESPIPSQHNEETEGMSDKSSGFEDISNSPHELSHSGVSFEEPNHFNASMENSVQGGRRRTPNDSEDDGTEGTKKRMRGLEDLGLGGTSSCKRKRSQVAHVHEFLKRKNRRRQLTKVLESTAMVTVPVMCEELTCLPGSSLPGVSDTKISRLESNELKRSLSVVINNNSDSTGDASNNATGHACDASLTNCKQKENEISSMSGLIDNDSLETLYDVPFIGEEKQLEGILDCIAGFSPVFVSCTSEKPHTGTGGQSSQSSLVETLSVGNDELPESGSTSSGAADVNNISHSIDNKGTSKWQLKGKRNLRNKSKTKKQDPQKHLDTSGLGDEGNALLATTDSFCYGVKSEQVNESNKESHPSAATAEVMAPQRLLPYRQSRFTVNPKYQSSDIAYRKHETGTLYDVNVEVKASYRPQHVPIISLMSKLTGQPIIGHPLQVEALGNGSVSGLLLNSTEYYSSSCELDGDLSGEDVDMVEEVKTKPRAKHPAVLQARGSPSKSPKKPRRNGLLSNKKIRRLSSLTGSKRPNDRESKSLLSVEKLKGPSVACVPLKVVFSRISAALSISSMRPMHCSAGGSNL